MKASSLFKTAALVAAGLLCQGTAMGKLVPGKKDLGAIWFIGDSITQSNADADPNGSPRKSLADLLTAAGYTYTYTGHFAANPEGLATTGAEPATNLYQYHSGISGSVIGANVGGRVGMTQGLGGFWTTGRLASVKPEVILIMLGANDINSNIEVAGAPDRLAAFIEAVHALPGIGSPTVFVASITPNRVKMPECAERVAAYNARIPEIVKAQQAKGRDVRFVDQFTPIDKDYTAAMRPDNLHPNANGNALIARQWFAAIEAVVKAPAILRPKGN